MKNSSNTIWVDSSFKGDSTGGFDAPFTSLQEALRFVEPAMVVNIVPGIYTAPTTIEVSGTITDPIRISGTSGSGDKKVVFEEGWFMYDTSDIIVENISFRKTKSHAIAVIGKCERNSFRNIVFDDCGNELDSACSLYFGGSGSSANVVEACEFFSEADSTKSIALMIASGDGTIEGGNNSNFLIRKNTFNNYFIGIALGTEAPESSISSSYSHVVENNHFVNTRQSAIVLRVGGTTVVNNVIRGGKYAIDVIFSPESCIVDNRIEDCYMGISVSSKGLYCSGNTIVNSLKHHILLNTGTESFSGVEIAQTTFVRIKRADGADINLEECSSAVVRDNIFYGGDEICSKDVNSGNNFFTGNISTDSYGCLDGVVKSTIVFDDFADMNFKTGLKAGSDGKSVSRRSVDYTVEELSEEQVKMLKEHGVDQSNFNEKFTKDLYVNSLFSDEEESLAKEESEFTDRRDIGEDGLVDFSTWD